MSRVVLGVVALIVACGTDSPPTPHSDAHTRLDAALLDAACGALGATCNAGEQCCTALCSDNACSICLADGTTCGSNDQCCGSDCVETIQGTHVCGGCIGSGGICTTDGACCNGSCDFPPQGNTGTCP